MNIIMVPFHDYKKWKKEGFRTRDAHVCEHFSRDNKIDKILVINRPTSLAEIILKREPWKTPEGEVEYKTNRVQLSKMSENVWCLDIFLLDFFKVAIQKKMWWFTAFNYIKVTSAIKEALEYLEMTDSILLLQNPMAIGVAKNIKYQKFVFDAIDNWLYHPQMPNKELIKENYEYVDKNADLIMTVSEALMKTFPNNKNIHWIPNGVDVDYFAKAKKEFRSVGKVIGYVGKIQDRVDFGLVEECLKEFPKEKFVFLGPVYSQNDVVNKLQSQYSNIEFTGDIHYSKLPDAMKEFDITIIPHKVDQFTESMNPLKLYEYLAAGKPVVTTGVAGTSAISSYVYISEEKTMFVNNLKTLIDDASSFSADEIARSIPDECQWNSRKSEMIKLISEM